jgi:hypothetical protein
MKDCCVRIKSHPVWAIVGNLRRQKSQAISRWRIKAAQKIVQMDAREIDRAIRQVFWRTIISAVSCNILLTQLLNFKYLKTILSFGLLLGSLIVAAWIVPFFDRMLMYVYTSWLLIFLLPITYWLTITAFDLHRFRNILITITAIISTFFYLLYPIQQFFNWEIELDLLTIANQISFNTILSCSAIFTIFSIIAKTLQLLPRIGIFFLKEIAN